MPLPPTRMGMPPERLPRIGLAWLTRERSGRSGQEHDGAARTRPGLPRSLAAGIGADEALTEMRNPR